MTQPEKEALQKFMTMPQFPLSAKYDIEWLNENEMGPCSTWLAEFLTSAMDLKPGTRVLDLGCGKAMSSIFLAREFDVQVWATDLWISATDNHKRIVEKGMQDRVFPINAEAHSLPYATEFFDSIVSLDSYHYYGTDEMYMSYISGFLKPNGSIGIVVPGVEVEWTAEHRNRIGKNWEAYNYTHHTPAWWRNLWQGSGCIDVQTADVMPHGFDVWLKWDKGLKEAGILKRSGDVEMLEAAGGNFTFTRVIGAKKDIAAS